MSELRDGGVEANGHRRWCAGHQAYHGNLHLCDLYPAPVRDEIQAATDRHVANLNDPEWCAREIANGMPPEGIEIYRTFAGLPPRTT